MTYEQKLEAAQAEYARFRELQGDYFQKSMDYARALGNGSATSSQRLELVAAKEAYYSA